MNSNMDVIYDINTRRFTKHYHPKKGERIPDTEKVKAKSMVSKIKLKLKQELDPSNRAKLNKDLLKWSAIAAGTLAAGAYVYHTNSKLGELTDKYNKLNDESGQMKDDISSNRDYIERVNQNEMTDRMRIHNLNVATKRAQLDQSSFNDQLGDVAKRNLKDNKNSSYYIPYGYRRVGLGLKNYHNG